MIKNDQDEIDIKKIRDRILVPLGFSIDGKISTKDMEEIKSEKVDIQLSTNTSTEDQHSGDFVTLCKEKIKY